MATYFDGFSLRNHTSSWTNRSRVFAIFLMAVLIPVAAPSAPVMALDDSYQWNVIGGTINPPQPWVSTTSSADGTKLAAASSSGFVYVSTDSGLSWNPQVSAGDRHWSAITSSADGTMLVAAESNGFIYISADSGLTWNPQVSAGQHAWRSIGLSTDGSKLIAAASNSSIFTSINSGAIWTEQVASGSRDWTSVVSSGDGSNLVAAVSNGSIYTSADSGITWTAQDSAGQHRWLTLTSSLDGTKLVAGADDDFLYVSTDSGLTWNPQVSAGQRAWKSITSSTDGSKLFAVADTDFIYYSADGGMTWAPQLDAGQSKWVSATSSADGTKAVVASIDTAIIRGVLGDSPETIPSDESPTDNIGAPVINQGEIPVPDLIVPLTPIQQLLSVISTPTVLSSHPNISDSQKDDAADSRDTAMNQTAAGDGASVRSPTDQETATPAEDGGNLLITSAVVASGAVLATIAYLLFRRHSGDN